MPRYADPTKDLGTVKREEPKGETLEDRAIYLLRNDPSITSMRQARQEAREQLELEAAYSKAGQSGASERKARRAVAGRPARERTPARATGRTVKRARPHRSSRPARANGSQRTVRKTVRTVAAPFGGVASAGWTFLTGALGVVFLYTVLRQADAVGAFADGMTSGIRRFADPAVPLIPTKGESSPPSPTRKVSRPGGTK
jgi:hypothetical protein